MRWSSSWPRLVWARRRAGWTPSEAANFLNVVRGTPESTGWQRARRARGEVDAVGFESIRGVLGDDGNGERGDAEIVGADGDAPFAQGALEAGGLRAAGEAAIALVGVGVEEGFDFGPSRHEDLFEV